MSEDGLSENTVGLTELSDRIDELLSTEDVQSLSVDRTVYSLFSSEVGVEPTGGPNPPQGALDDVGVYVDNTGTNMRGFTAFDDEKPIVGYTLIRDDFEWEPHLPGVPDFVKNLFPFLEEQVKIYERTMPIFDPTPLSDVFGRFEGSNDQVGRIVCNPSDIETLQQRLGDEINYQTNTIWGAALKKNDEVNQGDLFVLAGNPQPAHVAVQMREVEEVDNAG